MRRALLAIVAAAVVGAAGTAQRAEPAATAADDDVRLLMQQIRQVHPNAFHYTREATFQAAADELAGRAPSLSPDQLLVELMRFTNLLGERDGHSGIFPLDSSHRRVLHLFPLYLYKFSDGLFVVAAPRNRGLVGTKLLAVDGTAADELERQVRPLVPRDNEATRDDRFMSFMLTAEVLHGLGLRSGTGPARLTVQKPGEEPRDVTVAPVTAAEYLRLMKPAFPSFVYALPRRAKPLYLRRRGEDHYVTTLDRGRVVYVGYNLTLGSTGPLARRVSKLAARKRVRRVIVDVRLNPGGDNHTYAPLLRALRARSVNRPGRLVVLIGRSTFSAAENFITDLERRTRVTFVGETSGGSPNLYGDVERVDLASAGLSVNVAGVYWQKSFAADTRVAIEPKVAVTLSSSAYFRGRDPALAAALAYRLGR
ncbi:MAG TPA: S41 family peptidase [Gaiellaceae bacterium]|nr:S41 family peptidase [Gaiellaceae bacterium]